MIDKVITILKPSSIIICCLRFRAKIDYSRVPILKKEELEEKFVRGSGPGGQKINKTSSAVCLKHIPTGIVIKCHQSRFLPVNRKTARELLTNKLDNLINGENSVENQKKAFEMKKLQERNRRRNKLQEIKEEWKKHQEDNKES
ncbi:mitochondrial translation release factor in rescue [Harmonia axyridis]|uniref:mitochondrial translation release factor in rescue n=1 Tax=Harmonia axyridis TaxID=115357 RepID=UPI001E278EEA|nr:mitochondrial translation release factor in rescue [Harmonia axyridis]